MASAGPIVVGIDGTPRSRDALVLAGKLADPGQRLLLAHVQDYARLSTLLANGEFERLVRDVADVVERELRVVSARGNTDRARRVLLGSVSRALVRFARCPLVVLPRGAQAG